LRTYYTRYREWSQDFEEVVWAQLDKWNNISPIPAQQIIATAQQRVNLIQSNLMMTGSPNTSSQYTTMVVVGDKKVAMEEFPGFATLVGYLTKELGAGNE
jgi:hypothetical protein